MCEIQCVVYNFRKSFCRVYESDEKVLDVLFNSPAGLCLLMVCLKAAGIPITRQDCALISVVNGAARNSPVISLVIVIYMRTL